MYEPTSEELAKLREIRTASDLTAAQRLTTLSAEEYDDPFLDAAIYRFTPEDVSTFYATSYAFQRSAGFSDLRSPQARYLQREMGRSERHIVTASIDALTREILSAGEGGTVVYGSLKEDPEVKKLANQLSAETDSKFVTDEVLAMQGLRNHLSGKQGLIPAVIISNLFGMRTALHELHASHGLTEARVKELASAVGTICVTLFGAMLRNIRPGIARDTPLESFGYNNWLKFSKNVADFGNTTNPNIDVMTVDALIYANHGGGLGDGRMLVRTCSDYQETLAVLNAKDEHSETGVLKKWLKPDLINLLAANPAIDLFA